MEKLTYTTLGSLGEEFHQAFDAALAYEHKRLGRPHPLVIRGQKKKGQGILREMCHQVLRKYPHVARYRDGEPGEGGHGVTIADMD